MWASILGASALIGVSLLAEYKGAGSGQRQSWGRGSGEREWCCSDDTETGESGLGGLGCLKSYANWCISRVGKIHGMELSS